jgi:hypothetical protein
MNPFATFPGIVEISSDPLGAPVLIACVVVAIWFVVALVERGNQNSQDENNRSHGRSGGWW